MKNKSNIALAIFVIIAVLEFIFLKDILYNLPESREVLLQGVKNLFFAIIVVALFLGIISIPIIAISYACLIIENWHCQRKYQKAQKQILDDPIHWPGHHNKTEEKKD